jgi:carboxylesterase
MTRIAQVQARDDDGVNAVCGSIAMTHEAKVERAIVFLHGYTNCPEQFRILGEMFFERGYNVFIPRMPHQGLRDRLNEDQQNLTAEELIAWGTEAVDIAQGLGEHVSVAGISGGAVLTAWLAQTRSDIDLAVPIAPTFNYRQLPSGLTTQVTNLAYTIPNIFVWWNDEFKETIPGPEYGYPRFSTRAVAGILRLGIAVQTLARETTPGAARIIITTNPNDLIVEDALVDAVIANWQAHGANATVLAFSADLKIGHDVIDPNQPDQQTSVIYPLLVEWMTGG